MNVSELRHSKNLLERAACWAVTASWQNGNDFEDAQADCKALLELADIIRKHSHCHTIAALVVEEKNKPLK